MMGLLNYGRIFTLTEGAGQSILDCPALLYSLINGSSTEFQFVAPHRKRLGASLKDEPMRAARVVVLLDSGGPLAILGTIVAVAVFAFNRVFTRRSFAHISQEVLKRGNPSFTDRDATPPVIGVMAGLGITRVAQNKQASEALSGAVNKILTRWKREKLNVIFVAAHSVITSVNDVWVRAVERLDHAWRPVSILPRLGVSV